jgi:hypothetical protein
MRITAAQRTANENRIRAAMDRLLRGEIPPGGRCDIKTLAVETGFSELLNDQGAWGEGGCPDVCSTAVSRSWML